MRFSFQIETDRDLSDEEIKMFNQALAKALPVAFADLQADLDIKGQAEQEPVGFINQNERDK